MPVRMIALESIVTLKPTLGVFNYDLYHKLTDEYKRTKTRDWENRSWYWANRTKLKEIIRKHSLGITINLGLFYLSCVGIHSVCCPFFEAIEPEYLDTLFTEVYSRAGVSYLKDYTHQTEVLNVPRYSCPFTQLHRVFVELTELTDIELEVFQR